ncbi:MAG: lamin tail domain-containing protein, partial [Candidatus Aenigmarchaeota archaeon]|nr:lamin tail domain-containing protein [Candidatus Aenigmarchaeota archaeon]
VDCSPPSTSTYCVEGLCDAECDADGDCQPYIEGDYCHYLRPCDTAETCGCQEGEVDYCPVPGTLVGELCYYNDRSCTDEGCFIEVCELENNEMCDPEFGCILMPCIDIDPITEFSDSSTSKTMEFPLGGGYNDTAKVVVPMNFNATYATVNMTGGQSTVLGDNEVDLIVVNDVSGSMDDNCHCADGTPSDEGYCTPAQGYPYDLSQPCKIEDTKDATEELTNMLLIPNHNFEGLVSYSTNLVDFTPLTENKTLLLDEIDQYVAQGFTCISCGIQKGLDLVKVGTYETKVILLMSDGEANRCKAGMCTPATAKDEAKAVAQDAWDNHGVHVYAVAFGEDADTATMQEIADLGGGQYYYAATTNLTEVYLSIIYEVTKSYPHDVELDIGEDGMDWSYPGEFRVTEQFSNYHPDINSLIADCSCPGCTFSPIDNTCTIDFGFSSTTAGILIADELKIEGCVYTMPIECTTCEDCGGGSDCVQESDWSEWDCAWSDECDEQADCTRERTITTYTCHEPGTVQSYCSSESVPDAEGMSDTRDTDGNPCGELVDCSVDMCVGLDWNDYPEDGQGTCSGSICQEYSCTPTVYEFSELCDSDGDGVADDIDQCPTTPAGEPAGSDGCACIEKVCDDDDENTEDTCDWETGECVFEPLVDMPSPTFVGPKDGDMVSGEVKLWAIEDEYKENIESAKFEYSSDGVGWNTIGTDNEGEEYATEPMEDDYSGGGVPDEFNPSAQPNIELEGWTMNWDTAGLSEGWYYVKVTMRNSDEIQQSEQMMVYVDPTPPVPVLTTVDDESTIDGVIELIDTTEDENVETIEWELIPASGYYEKGVPGLSQHDYGDGHGVGGADIGSVYCAPTSTAASLKYWGTHGYPQLMQYPNGSTMSDEAIVEELARLMGTNGTSSGGGVTGGTTKGGILRGVREYINAHGGGFIVNDTFNPTLSDYRRELDAAKEDVLVWLKWYVWDGSDWVRSGAHVVDGNSVNNTRNPDNTTGVDFMDPWTGSIAQKTMSDDGWIRWSDYRWAKVWNIVTISPDVPDSGTTVGVDTDGSDGWSAYLNTYSFGDGIYFLKTTATDATGFSYSQTKLVYIDNGVCELTGYDLTVETDSPEYLVEDSVTISGMLRNPSCMPVSEKIGIEVRNGYGTVIFNQEVTSNLYGYYSASFTLPEDSMLGTYTVDAAYDGLAHAETTFDVVSETCEPVWECTEWSVCSVDGLQFRTCEDTECGLEPIEENQSCTYIDETKIVINEFSSDPAEGDEWIEIFNGNDADVQLDGWTIEDNTGSTYAFQTGGNSGYILDGYYVPANGYLLLERGTDHAFILNNGGDIIILKHGDDVVDQVTYGSYVDGDASDNAPNPAEGESCGRIEDGYDTNVDIDDFTIFGTPTPGEPNGPAGGETVEIQLYEGWNLISIPLEQSDWSVGAVLESIDGKYDMVKAYDTQTDSWSTYLAEFPELSSLTEMNIADGFWVRMTEDGTLTVTGTVPESTERTMYEGWNLIGYPSLTTEDVGTALASIDGQYDMVKAYDTQTDSWSTYLAEFPELSSLTEMATGHGYWARMTEGGILTI